MTLKERTFASELNGVTPDQGTPDSVPAIGALLRRLRATRTLRQVGVGHRHTEQLHLRHREGTQEPGAEDPHPARKLLRGAAPGPPADGRPDPADSVPSRRDLSPRRGAQLCLRRRRPQPELRQASQTHAHRRATLRRGDVPVLHREKTALGDRYEPERRRHGHRLRHLETQQEHPRIPEPRAHAVTVRRQRPVRSRTPPRGRRLGRALDSRFSRQPDHADRHCHENQGQPVRGRQEGLPPWRSPLLRVHGPSRQS